ncbi:Phosphate starvation-inducible protein PhoH [Planctomycetales bacterium 10988]|nr:Phosphate starvation-inducible protein PhoH [Planctomycetales bacterium 10988]
MNSTVDANPKLFVLDTNVILHDAGCILNFEENDIAIPITVLEELDHFKRGDDVVNFQARQFLRHLDSLTGDLLSTKGASLGEGRGTIRVVLGSGTTDRLQSLLLHNIPDHRILAIALQIQDQEKPRPAILVSKDTNLRLKAKSFGLPAEDYTTDKVENFDKLYTGKRTVENIPSEVIDLFYNQGGQVDRTKLPTIEGPRCNENFILRNGKKSALATYLAETDEFRRVEKLTAYGITPRNAEQSFALRLLMDEDIRLVSIAGKAGTGKTLLALAAALECRSLYRQILLARPVVPLSNRDLGFLPGDISAKLDPYMQPLYDNLAVIRNQFSERDPPAHRIQQMLESQKLQISPLAYIRGRSLQRVFFIIDEAQNLTPHEVKTIITRAGEGTKIVLTGDIHQIDQPYLDSLSNGLSYLINRMVGQPLYAHVTLEQGERSLLADIASQLL